MRLTEDDEAGVPLPDRWAEFYGAVARRLALNDLADAMADELRRLYRPCYVLEHGNHGRPVLSGFRNILSGGSGADVRADFEPERFLLLRTVFGMEDHP